MTYNNTKEIDLTHTVESEEPKDSAQTFISDLTVRDINTLTHGCTSKMHFNYDFESYAMVTIERDDKQRGYIVTVDYPNK